MRETISSNERLLLEGPMLTRDRPWGRAGSPGRSARPARGIQCPPPWRIVAGGWWPSCQATYLPLNRRVRRPVSSENPLGSSRPASELHVRAVLTARIRPKRHQGGPQERSPATCLEYTYTRSRKSHAAE